MDNQEKLFLKIYHHFNGEMNGFESYLKLAKEYPEASSEFNSQAMIEYEQAESMKNLFEQMFETHHAGEDIEDNLMFETMQQKIDSAERKMMRMHKNK